MSKQNKTSSKKKTPSKEKILINKKNFYRPPVQIFKDVKPNTTVKSLVLYNSSKFALALKTIKG
jgi:hypothetical protein